MLELLDRAVVYSGYLSVEKLQLRLADGSVVSREVERHGEAAAVLPYDAQRRCALVVRLFRAPVFSMTGEPEVEEACAGMLEGDQSDEATARREAREELGVSLGLLEPVARIWSSPGVSTERQSLFLAPYTLKDRVAQGGGVAAEHEGITVVERALAALKSDVERGIIVDGKLLTLVLALCLRKPALFEGNSLSR